MAAVQLHTSGVIHRDLTEPGKNALIKRDALGVSYTEIDLPEVNHYQVATR